MNNTKVGFALSALCLFALSANAQKKKCPDPNAPGQNIYKHYTGTLGSEKIVLDLRYGYCGGSNYGGSTWYYPGKAGTTLFYIGEPASYEHNIPLSAEEQSQSNNINDAFRYDRTRRAPEWNINITGDKFTGKRYNAITGKQDDVLLKEDYSVSVPFDLVSLSDTAPNSSFIFVQPSALAKAGDSKFITSEQLRLLGSDKTAATLHEHYANKIKGNPSYVFLMPVYNDNGMLVLEYTTLVSSGAAPHQYLCLDVRNQKVVTLRSITNASDSLLSIQLETALRKKFNLDATKELTTWFTANKVPVSEDIMLSQKGITFYYNDNLFAPAKQYTDNFANSPVQIFIPYEQLKPILQTDFRKRIGI